MKNDIDISPNENIFGIILEPHFEGREMIEGNRRS
jgi:hypothetical protein